MIVWAVTDTCQSHFPPTANVSPGVEGAAHTVDRLHDSVAGTELHVQVVDVQQMLALDLTRFGSRLHCTASPSMMKLNTATDKEIAGKKSMNGPPGCRAACR